MTVEDDFLLEAGVITPHVFICGADFRGKVDLHHVTTDGSLEICSTSFQSWVNFNECDLTRGVRFANDFFKGGFYAKDCSFREYLRFVGRGSYPSQLIQLEDVVVASAIQVRDVALVDLVLKSVDCNSLAITKVAVSGGIDASELTITKRLFVSDNEIGALEEDNPAQRRKVDCYFADVFVGTTARLNKNEIRGPAIFSNIVANSLLAFDKSHFESTTPTQFNGLTCSTDCSFADTTFSVGPEMRSLSVADQLIFRGASIFGRQPLSISACNINGTAIFDFKDNPQRVSLTDTYFKALVFSSGPSGEATTYDLEGMDFQRIVVSGSAPDRWVRLMRSANFSEPFSSRLRTFLLEDGQKESADRVRVELKHHKRATLSSTWPRLIDQTYDMLLEYGTSPSKGLWIFPIVVFVAALFIYRKSKMEYVGGRSTAGGLAPRYWSIVYAMQKMIPFFYLPELDGWKPRDRMGWFFLLLFPLAQLSFGVFLAHYAFDLI